MNTLLVLVKRGLWASLCLVGLTACGGGGDDDNTGAGVNSALDIEVRDLATALGITGDAAEGRTLPDISDPIPQLGMLLFFSKSLGGAFDAACVSCHHPALGGGDALSLSVGVEALNPDLLGPGREHSGGLPPVPRNAPTVFNAGLWDTGMFWDSRVESLGREAGANGSISGIRTPDSSFGIADANAGANLPSAQARFPVTSDDEMKTSAFENGSDNDTIRAHLAARIGDYGVGAGELARNEWLVQFQNAFVSAEPASTLITFDNIAFAIGEYERSMVFTDTPWRQFLEGDSDAISDDAKQGALLFFRGVGDGGAGCAICHSGDLFSDGNHHTVAFPQFGPGKGDGGSDDFGRERETGDSNDRYRFRTPSLLNVAVTGPYGHAGVYETLEEVVRHYINPRQRIRAFFNGGGACTLEQFEALANCATLYPDAEANSLLAADKLDDERALGVSLFLPVRLNGQEVQQLVAFLETLTDTCVADRSCIDAWIADTGNTGPDDQQLNAVDLNGDLL